MISEKIGEAEIDVKLKLGKLKDDLKDAERKTKKSTSKMSKSFSDVKGGIGKVTGALMSMKAALAGVAALGGLSVLVKSSMSVLDNLDKTSSKLGITTDFLQKVEYAASQSGIAMNTVSVAMQRYTRRASEAAQGTGIAKDAMKELGITAVDVNGNLKDTETLMFEVMEALAGVENSGDRVRLAMRFFDTEGVSLVNMAANFGSLTEKAEELGLVLDKTLIKEGVEATDKLDTLTRVIKANLTGAIMSVAPILLMTAEAFAELAKAVGETWARWKDLEELGTHGIRLRISGLEDEAEGIQKAFQAAYNTYLELNRMAPAREHERLLNQALALEDTYRDITDQINEANEALRRMEFKENITPNPSDTYAVRKHFDEYKIAATDASEKIMSYNEKIEAQMSGMWDGFSKGFSSSFARMVSEGKISFKKLGEAFVAEFIQRTVREMIMTPLLNLLGNALGSVFGGANTGADFTFGLGPIATQYPIIDIPYVNAPGTIDVSKTPPYASGSSFLSQPTKIIINNNTPYQSSVKETAGSTKQIEVAIGGMNVKDIVEGGQLSTALEKTYGLTRSGVRRG